MDKTKRIEELLSAVDSEGLATTITNISNVSNLLKEGPLEISDDCKEKIANEVLCFEQKADELKAACHEVLQCLPEHRVHRGRDRGSTGNEADARNTESGYASCAVVSSLYENEEQPEKVLGEQPSPNGCPQLAVTNGCKQTLRALLGTTPKSEGNQELSPTNAAGESQELSPTNAAEESQELSQSEENQARTEED